MTQVALPPPGPLVTVQRDGLGTVQPTTPAAPLLNARAVKPPPPGEKPADLRPDDMRGRPVGPPPAFDINVLQDIQARLAHPENVRPLDEGEDTPSAPQDEGAEPPVREAGSAPRPDFASSHEPPPPQKLDQRL